MSELKNSNVDSGVLRGRLLASVCAGTLFAVLHPSYEAVAKEADSPTVWIELGGQWERMSDGIETFAPPFLSKFEHLPLDPILPLQSPSRNSFGAEGKISFAPNNSDWTFSAAVRYGRSNKHRVRYQQLPPQSFYDGFKYPTQKAYQSPPYYLNSTARTAESHAIIDFKAGKDVGLGLLSADGSSVLSFGVRLAQFTSSRRASISGVPDFFHSGDTVKYTGLFFTHHRYVGTADTQDSFRGIGPSLSWDASAPIIGQDADREITLDWGINAAVLFGRQKVRGNVNKTGEHFKSFQKSGLNVTNYTFAYTIYNGVASAYHNHPNVNRSRSVLVPNLGGFAGLSFRYAAAKVSFGYRADFFFGAMDGGLEARKTFDRAFYGPFATISIGFP